MIPTKAQWQKALTERHGVELQRRISSATVAVCGLGGLGSVIAATLARTGIGRLILIDSDRVDITNLHRQQYKIHQTGMYKTEALCDNLREINPFLQTTLHTLRLDRSNAGAILADADIVCEAFDSAQSKAELVDFVLTEMKGKYIVAASGMAGMGSCNSIKTRKITDHFYLCGDGVSDISDGMGLVAPRVMLCAAHQAHTALRIIAEKKEGMTDE